MTTYAHIFDSPVDKIFVAVNERGALLKLEFLTGREPEELAAGVKGPVVWDEGRCRHVEEQIGEYFHGARRDFDLEVDLRGTEFQRTIWEELRRIPYGETRSYGQLAARLGRPKAVRAVGRANATNPICIVVPCHRVIGADGSLTGFGGGLGIKRALLMLEGALPELFV